MQVMHDLPIFSHHGSPIASNQEVKSKMLFVMDITSDTEEDQSVYRYRPTNLKFNEPPKIASSKENGFDYFSPVMKYRG